MAVSDKRNDFNNSNVPVVLEETGYNELAKQVNALIEGIPYLIANLSNVSALLKQELEGINWVGFYMMEDDKLVLGPFQGRPACIEIPVGKGVCGTAVAEDEIMLVEDVREFPGHIACDAASRSEIVLPVRSRQSGKIVAVLDIDSPVVGRFTEVDRNGLKVIVELLEVLWK